MPQSLPRPDSPTLQRRAALAGGEPRRMMAAAGAWLRESDPEGHEEAAEAIAGIEPGRLVEVAAEIDVGACAEALARATREAFDAALEEDEDEREALADSVLEALGVRDEAESTLVALAFALDRMEGERGALAEVAQTVREAMSAVDQAARRGAHPLTAVNPQRRERAESLAAEHRAAAWWFSYLAEEENDGLIEALAGREDVPVGAAAASLASRATLPSRDVAFAGALRAVEMHGAVSQDDPCSRWVRSEGERSEGAALAGALTRSLRVEDLAASDLDGG